MSKIFQALKRADQERRRKRARERGVPEPPTFESAADGRFGLGTDDLSPGDRALWEGIAREAGYETVPDFAIATEEAGTRGLFTTRGIAATTLALLLLVAGALAYHTWLRPGGVTTDLATLTQQTNETQTHLAKLDSERLRLIIENDSLRQQNEAARAELTRTRETLHALKVRQQQRTSRTSQPSTVSQVTPGVVPPTTHPPSMAAPQAQGKQRPHLAVVETPSTKIYSIR